MLEAAEGLPINVGFTGKGQATNPTALIEQINAGAIGLKYMKTGVQHHCFESCIICC